MAFGKNDEIVERLRFKYEIYNDRKDGIVNKHINKERIQMKGKRPIGEFKVYEERG